MYVNEIRSTKALGRLNGDWKLHKILKIIKKCNKKTRFSGVA